MAQNRGSNVEQQIGRGNNGGENAPANNVEQNNREANDVEEEEEQEEIIMYKCRLCPGSALFTEETKEIHRLTHKRPRKENEQKPEPPEDDGIVPKNVNGYIGGIMRW